MDHGITMSWLSIGQLCDYERWDKDRNNPSRSDAKRDYKNMVYGYLYKLLIGLVCIPWEIHGMMMAMPISFKDLLISGNSLTQSNPFCWTVWHWKFIGILRENPHTNSIIPRGHLLGMDQFIRPLLHLITLHLSSRILVDFNRQYSELCRSQFLGELTFFSKAWKAHLLSNLSPRLLGRAVVSSRPPSHPVSRCSPEDEDGLMRNNN